MVTINLNRKLVHPSYNLRKLLVLKQVCGDDVIIYDPGKMGVVMITSERKDVSAKDMIKEPQIFLLKVGKILVVLSFII